MNILVSACLLGVAVRYDGRDNFHEAVASLRERHCLIPVCAEVFGGLPTPRTPAERAGHEVVARDGRNVTACYERGAQEVMKLQALYQCTWAILKERSPACGKDLIYDGTFTHTLIPGNGLLAERLLAHGVRVVGEREVPALIEEGVL